MKIIRRKKKNNKKNTNQQHITIHARPINHLSCKQEQQTLTRYSKAKYYKNKQQLLMLRLYTKHCTYK